jgi:methylated-DNA-[protein]-cysteine S-methyltransferase
MKLHLSRFASPIGELLIVVDEQGAVRALDFADHEGRLRRLLSEHYGSFELSNTSALPAISSALERYFAGDLTALDSIATATNGSMLQRRIWSALRRIPAGSTASYSELARSVGLSDPRAAIDVGAANSSNPVAIIVPCHRVIAKNGGLKGYAGGPHRKRWLLKHEGALLMSDTAPAVTLRLPGL